VHPSQLNAADSLVGQHSPFINELANGFISPLTDFSPGKVQSIGPRRGFIVVDERQLIFVLL
jgi:hypothetical protein